MANPEHLKILKQGVKQWNKWREEQPEARSGEVPLDVSPDLSRDLSLAELEQSKFRVISVWGMCGPPAGPNEIDRTRAQLRDADLRGAELAEAHLSGANLMAADFAGADLSHADLRGADLRGAYLVGANLSRAHLLGANLNLADLRRANLSGAFLIETDLSGTYLIEANLGGGTSLQSRPHECISPRCRPQGSKAYRGGLHSSEPQGGRLRRGRVSRDKVFCCRSQRRGAS